MRKTKLSKLVKLIAAGAIASTAFASVPFEEKAVQAQNNPKTTQSNTVKARAAANDFDISTGWNVLNYSSDLDVPVQNTFLQGRRVQDPSGKNYNTAYINFANIGNSVFKAQRVFHLKKGKTYNFSWYYQLRVLNHASASISFNGDVKTAGSNYDQILPQQYKKTIVAKEDQDYTVTLEYDAPKYSNVFMSVGYLMGDPNNGVITEEVPSPKLSTLEAGQKQAQGSGVAGNHVVLKDASGQEIGSGIVGQNGQFLIDLNRPLIYDETITAVQIDSSGSASEAVSAKVQDTTPPDKPIAKDIEVSEQILNGSAETNAQILATNAQGDLVGKGIANDASVGNGQSKFSIHLTQPVKVGDKIAVKAVDEAGNASQATTVLVVDTVKPGVPVVNPVDDTMKQISGTGSKVGSQIVVSINDQVLYGKVGEDKHFTVNLTKPIPGGTKIKVVEVDTQNNQSDPAVVTVKGTVKTAVPVVDVVGDSSKSVTGQAEPNSQIKVFIGQDFYTAKADNNGAFVVRLNETYPASTQGTVTATGQSGIESNPVGFTVKDTTAPEKPILNTVLDNETQISGTTEPLATVRVSLGLPNGSVASYVKKADQNGKFTIDLARTFPAGTTITATAEDESKNVSSAFQSIVMDSVELDITLNPITSQDKHAIGNVSRPNSEVTVKVGDRLFKTKADAKGNFIVDLERRYPIGTPVSAWVISMKEKGEIVPQSVVPRIPTFETNKIPEVGDQMIVVNADPGSFVTLSITPQHGSPDVLNEVTNSNGQAIFRLTKPVASFDTLQCYSEVNGVKSEESTVVVF
ncbi:Ig-like domain-containing protein [Listeria valentina]|uniref:Ig-like domain-containing protein n=1 Tax=Listeria valentina TaxID=2705293 RepID=UPI001430C667|nr:Ig-like domain-containing protein [Listeria valentina]